MMRRGRRGLTIAEGLISAAILAVVLTTLFNLYPAAFLAIHNANQAAQAGAVAQSVLEQQRALVTDATEPGTRAETPVLLDGVTYRPTVTFYDARNDAKLKGIRVKVTWDDRGASHRTTRELWVCSIPR